MYFMGKISKNAIHSGIQSEDIFMGSKQYLRHRNAASLKPKGT